MKTVLVNASAAKVGGAEVILRQFIAWLAAQNLDCRFIVISGCEISCPAENIEIKYSPTDGLRTFVYSSLLITREVLRYRPDAILSFNNVNAFVSAGAVSVTYFHQTKLFAPQDTRTRILAATVRVQRQAKYVCQTNRIASDLRTLVGSSASITVAWPGVPAPPAVKSELSQRLARIRKKRIAICPIVDVRSAHKGFDALYASREWLVANNVRVIVTSDPYHYAPSDAFEFVGNLQPEVLQGIYAVSEFLIFPSRLESLGLPIVESLSHGLKVVLRDVDYARALTQQFALDEHVQLVGMDSNGFEFDLDRQPARLPAEHAIFQPEWHKVIQLVMEA